VVVVVFHLVVLPKEDLHATPRGLDGVGVGPGVRIEEVDAVVHSAVRVTLRTEIAVCTPAITDDCSASFDPVMYDGHQCVGGSVLHGNKKCSAGLLFHTSKHPLTLNRVSPMILSPTELSLINLNSFLRTTNLNRPALQKHQHGFPAEHAPVCDCMCTQAIFVLYLVGLFTAHDVVRDEQNFLEVRLLC